MICNCNIKSDMPCMCKLLNVYITKFLSNDSRVAIDKQLRFYGEIGHIRSSSDTDYYIVQIKCNPESNYQFSKWKQDIKNIFEVISVEDGE